MVRIIETRLTPIVDFVISTNYANGKVSNNIFKEGDLIENLRYVLNNDIETITGRLAKINYKKKTIEHRYNSVDNAKSYFSEDVTASSINIDCSKEYNSKVVNVPANEIIEFIPNGDEVKRMSYKLKYGVHFEVELSDTTTNVFDIHEGSIYQEFTYLDLEHGVDKTSEVKVAAITCNSALYPNKIVFIEDGIVKEIDIKLVKNVNKEITSTEMNVDDVNTALTTNEDGIVNLSSGNITSDLSITKDVSIIGANPDVKVNSAKFKGKDTGTVFSGNLNIAEDASVKMKGITLTTDAYIKLVKDSKELTLENCIIKDLTPYQKKSYGCLINGTEPIKLVIKNCYFGKNTIENDSAYYNLFENNQKLADGSEIANNYFEESVCKNNIICIYDVEDNANIYIHDNIFEYSCNAVRIGTKGDAKCNIIIENNTYYKTSTNTPEYAGLLLVQPYGKQTTNMSNVNIELKGNKHFDKLQLYYLYSGANDMPFTDENKPKITVK